MTETPISAPRVATRVFVLDGITYVPHYQNRQLYVAPGASKEHCVTYTADELARAGARPEFLMLWPRPELNHMKAANAIAA